LWLASSIAGASGNLFSEQRMPVRGEVFDDDEPDSTAQ
jgi:hypothetical protein